MAKYFGFGPPFLTGNVGLLRVLPRQTDVRLVRNDLIQLLLTAPGERVMRPTYGSGVRPTLFEQIDNVQINKLRKSINEAIEQYEPRVSVASILIDRNENNNLINVKIYGSVNTNDNVNSNDSANLLIEFNLPGKIGG